MLIFFGSKEMEIIPPSLQDILFFSVRNLLKDFEDVLPSDQFIRIHKSYIVRIDEINSINTKEMKVAKDLVPVGRTYYHGLVNRIQKLSPSGD